MAQFVRPSIRQYVYSYVVCMSLSIFMYVLMSDKIDISLEHLSLSSKHLHFIFGQTTWKWMLCSTMFFVLSFGKLP